MNCPYNQEEVAYTKVQDDGYKIAGSPKRHFLLGSIPEMKKGAIEFLIRNATNYGDLIPFYVGQNLALQINHPDLIEHITVKNHKNYRKGDNYIRFEDYLGKGILTSYGNKWKKDRQMLQPSFNRELIEGFYAETALDVISDIEKKWTQDSNQHNEVNTTVDMSYYTINVALRTLFGNEITDEQIITLDTSTRHVLEFTGLPRMFPRHNTNKIKKPFLYVKASKAAKFINDFVREMSDKNDKDSGRNNILSIMQKARYEDGSAFTHHDLMDQAITMIFAGYETTASLLQWIWFTLAKHPDTQNKLREEIASNIKDAENLTFQEVSKLEYLDQVFCECARLYPSLWGSTRAPLEDDIIGGYKVKAGTTMLIPTIALHRHPKWWEQPEDFIPERFTKEKKAQIHNGIYLPFSLGPRKCIGAKFAEMEIKMILAKLLPKFEVTAVPGQTIKLKPVISLRNEKDLMVYVRKI